MGTTKKLGESPSNFSGAGGGQSQVQKQVSSVRKSVKKRLKSGVTRQSKSVSFYQNPSLYSRRYNKISNGETLQNAKSNDEKGKNSPSTKSRIFSIQQELMDFNPLPEPKIADKFLYFYRPYNLGANTSKFMTFDDENVQVKAKELTTFDSEIIGRSHSHKVFNNRSFALKEDKIRVFDKSLDLYKKSGESLWAQLSEKLLGKNNAQTTNFVLNQARILSKRFQIKKQMLRKRKPILPQNAQKAKFLLQVQESQKLSVKRVEIQVDEQVKEQATLYDQKKEQNVAIVQNLQHIIKLDSLKSELQFQSSIQNKSSMVRSDSLKTDSSMQSDSKIDQEKNSKKQVIEKVENETLQDIETEKPISQNLNEISNSNSNATKSTTNNQGATMKKFGQKKSKFSLLQESQDDGKSSGNDDLNAIVEEESVEKSDTSASKQQGFDKSKQSSDKLSSSITLSLSQMTKKSKTRHKESQLARKVTIIDKYQKQADQLSLIKKETTQFRRQISKQKVQNSSAIEFQKMLTNVKRRERIALQQLEAKERGEEFSGENFSHKSKESIRNIDLNVQRQSSSTIADGQSQTGKKPQTLLKVRRAPTASRQSSKFNVGYAAMFRSTGRDANKGSTAKVSKKGTSKFVNSLQNSKSDFKNSSFSKTSSFYQNNNLQINGEMESSKNTSELKKQDTRKKVKVFVTSNDNFDLNTSAAPSLLQAVVKRKPDYPWLKKKNQSDKSIPKFNFMGLGGAGTAGEKPLQFRETKDQKSLLNVFDQTEISSQHYLVDPSVEQDGGSIIQGTNLKQVPKKSQKELLLSNFESSLNDDSSSGSLSSHSSCASSLISEEDADINSDSFANDLEMLKEREDEIRKKNRKKSSETMQGKTNKNASDTASVYFKPSSVQSSFSDSSSISNSSQKQHQDSDEIQGEKLLVDKELLLLKRPVMRKFSSKRQVRPIKKASFMGMTASSKMRNLGPPTAVSKFSPARKQSQNNQSSRSLKFAVLPNQEKSMESQFKPKSSSTEESQNQLNLPKTQNQAIKKLQLCESFQVIQSENESEFDPTPNMLNQSKTKQIDQVKISEDMGKIENQFLTQRKATIHRIGQVKSEGEGFDNVAISIPNIMSPESRFALSSDLSKIETFQQNSSKIKVVKKPQEKVQIRNDQKNGIYQNLRQKQRLAPQLVYSDTARNKTKKGVQQKQLEKSNIKDGEVKGKSDQQQSTSNRQTETKTSNYQQNKTVIQNKLVASQLSKEQFLECLNKNVKGQKQIGDKNDAVCENKKMSPQRNRQSSKKVAFSDTLVQQPVSYIPPNNTISQKEQLNSLNQDIRVSNSRPYLLLHHNHQLARKQNKGQDGREIILADQRKMIKGLHGRLMTTSKQSILAQKSNFLKAISTNRSSHLVSQSFDLTRNSSTARTPAATTTNLVTTNTFSKCSEMDRLVPPSSSQRNYKAVDLRASWSTQLGRTSVNLKQLSGAIRDTKSHRPVTARNTHNKSIPSDLRAFATLSPRIQKESNDRNGGSQLIAQSQQELLLLAGLSPLTSPRNNIANNNLGHSRQQSERPQTGRQQRVQHSSVGREQRRSCVRENNQFVDSGAPELSMSTTLLSPRVKRAQLHYKEQTKSGKSSPIFAFKDKDVGCGATVNTKVGQRKIKKSSFNFGLIDSWESIYALADEVVQRK